MSVLCDTDSGCARKARWYITTKAGESAMCDLHAEFYLRQGKSIYPRRGVPGMLIPCQRDENCWLSDRHDGPHEHIDREGRRIVVASW